MKCPHCGQEHPDSFQFCPTTGNKIEKTEEFVACTNQNCPDFGKMILPADSKFCPTCGSPICNEANASNSFWVKLRQGIISYGGIVLGKTTIGDLRRQGFTKDDYSEKYLYEFSDEDDSVECLAWNCSPRDLSDYSFIEEISERFPGGDYNNTVLINKEKFVSGIKIEVDKITKEDIEDWELIDMLEDCGFDEIDIDDSGSYDEDVVFLVSKNKICDDYHALIILDTDMQIFICHLAEWTIRKTGEVIHA